MEIELNDYFGSQLKLKPRVELYSVKDFMGKQIPGLAIVFDTADEYSEPYGVLTKSFGEMIGLKDCAYVDTNNFPFANQLLESGIAEDTGFTKQSGFCTYPLWRFREDFLIECGGEKYKEYSEAYDRYFGRDLDDDIEDVGFDGGNHQIMV